MTWDPVKDRGWRREAVPRIQEICESCRTWGPEYANHVEEIVEFAVARVEGCLATMKDADCIVYFDQVALFNITVTNPERIRRAEKGYPQLRTHLEENPDKDAVPVVLRRIGGQFAVWDGHHRLRTYDQANRLIIPAIVAWFVPGTGKVKLVSKRREASAEKETGSPEPTA